MAKGKKSKRSKGRKSGRLTKREIKKAGGIKQAWAARKRGKTKTTRKAARTSKKKSARKSPRKSPRKARKSPKRAKARKSRKSRKSSRRGSSNTSHTSRTVRSTVVRHLPGHTSAIVVSPLPGKPSRRRGRKAGKRRSKGRKGRKGGRRKGRKGKGRRAREGYAMENPLSGVELALGLFTGALGFGVADFVDRFLATHALAVKTAATSTTPARYQDNVPSAGGSAGYQGLLNGTAVLAPMNLPRWGAAIGVAAVPFVAAAFVKAPAGRSALQMFGFGAAMRTLGKGMSDLVGKLTVSTAVGQRLYVNEQRAAALQTLGGGGTDTTENLVSSGLGATVAGLGKACGKCGMGSCSCSAKSQPAAQQMQAPPPPPPPAMQQSPQAQPALAPLAGVPQPMKNPYLWGASDDLAAE